MTNTTYYNLNIVDGTDIVNPLTVDNPNYEKIDETMHNNAVSGVTLATEIANATVHALNRENSECSVIRFIATSIWKSGDTMTVDGVPVTTLLPSGETLPDGAYVISANVLCILTGTNLTVYAERKKTDNASEIRYKDTTVADAITNINSNLTPVELHVDMSTTYCNPVATTVRAIKSGNIISFNGKITTAKQTSSLDTVRVGIIRDITLFSAMTVAANANSTVAPIMSVKENGEIYLNTDNLPVGTDVRFNACLISAT